MGFFGGMPFPVQFFLAFIIVLGLIGATAWAVRRFGGGRLGSVGLRGRQPRLAVVDYASVDARRRLLLIRRDNVEHLVMIGGPTDVVVESNIVRASPAQRDLPTSARAPATESLPRPIALPDNTANGSWLPPEHAPPASAPRAARGEYAPAEPAAFPLQLPPEPQPRPQPQRETLAALADELAPKPPMPPRSRPQAPRPLIPEPRQEAPHDPRPEPRQDLRQDSRQEARQEPRLSPAQSVSAEAAATTDQSLAEMAHRLEAALRKPNAKPDRNPAPEPRAVPMPRAPMPPAEQLAAAEPAPPPPPAAPSPAPVPLSPRPARAAEAKSPRVDAKPPSAGKTLYDSLEQEMASLLGRSAKS